jgi:hypothetical protein
MPQSLSQAILHIVFSTNHQRRTFQEEYRSLLENYHVEFDERSVWD